MSILAVIYRKLLSFFLWFLGLFRRAICRIRRGRKDSGNILPMTNNHVVPNLQAVPSNNEVELESWDSWGMEDTAAAMQQQQQQNNNSSRIRSTSQASTEEEPDIDYFQDMQPDFKRTKKILIKKRDNNFTPSGMTNRLAMQADMVPPLTNELETWEEADNAWGEEATEDLTWEAEEAIKEKKRLERERRHAEQQRKKMEKELTKSNRKDSQFTAVRLS